MSSSLIEPFVATPPSGRQSRREELLRAAARLFAERGYDGVTVEDIGGDVGMSGPALYYHFPSKEALLGEMLVTVTEYVLNNALAISKERRDPDALLEELIWRHATMLVDRPELVTVQYRNLSHASAADRLRVASLQRQYVQIWADALVQRYSGLDPEIARAAVYATIGLLNSTPFSSLLEREPMIALLVAQASAALAVTEHI
jgi:AcrR family transcriptional regulator